MSSPARQEITIKMNVRDDAVPAVARAELERGAQTLEAEVHSLRETNPRTAGPEVYQRAGEVLLATKAILTQAHDLLDPICDANHKAWKVALAQRAKVVEPLEKLETTVKAWISTWTEEDERRRREETLRLEAEARARDEEARLAEALALEAVGASAEAEAVLDEPPPPPPPPVPAATRVAGVAMKTTWVARVTSLRELCAAIGRGEVPEHYVTPSMVPLNAEAKARQKALRIPGVEAVEQKSVAAARR